MRTGEMQRRGTIGAAFGRVLGLFSLVALLAARDARAQPATATAAPRPAIAENQIEVGGRYQVWCRGPWTSARRIPYRPPALWQLYMHGVVDFFASPVPWEILLGPNQSADRWLDRSGFLKNEMRASNMPALKLGSGDSILLENRLPVPQPGPEGGAIRVFVWLRAEDADGHGDSELLPTRTPSVEVLVQDAIGRTVAVHRGPMRTRGTFGWHCYHLDVPFPVVAPSFGDDGGARAPATPERTLHVRLKNPTRGTAWFSTLSWELVREANTYLPEDRQDPTTGSLAPFPAADEFAVHLVSGRAFAHPWRFFSGSSGGAPNVPNLTAATAIAEYVREAAKTDPTGSLGGAVFLGPWLHAAAERPDLLSLPAEWHRSFRDSVLSLQDSGTGFWGTAECPLSMAATVCVVENLWGGEGGKRPWLNYGGSLPRAKAIVKTVLDARSPAVADGVDVSTWGSLAYHWRGPDEPETDACSLATTRNAMVLLRLADAALPERDRTLLQQAMGAAWRGVLRTCVQEDGIWKLSAKDSTPSRPAFLPRILELSGWLEERTDEKLPAPAVGAAALGRRGEELEFTWNEPVAGIVSVRIFAAPAGTEANAVHVEHVIGIMELDGTSLRTMDPIHAVGYIRNAARDRWGVDIGSGGDVPLVASRLALFDRLKGIAKGRAPLRIQVAEPAKRLFFAAGVNAEGQQTPLVAVVLQGLPEKTEAPTETEEPGALPADPPADPPAEM